MINIKELLTEFLKFVNNIIEIISSIPKRDINNKKNIVYIQEESKPVECISFLKTIKKVDKCVIPYEIKKEYKVIKKDLICKSDIFAKSAINNLGNFEFNIVSSNWNDFYKNKYVCYDLNSDNMDDIYPDLISYNGFAKRLRFSLDKSVNKNEDIKVQLNFTNKGCMCDTRCYIITDFNYKKLNLNKYTVIIRIKDFKTKNIRIYLVNNRKLTYKFLEKIFPIDNESDFYEDGYTSFVHNVNINDINNSTSLVYYFDK